MHDHAPHDLPPASEIHPLISRLETEYGYPRLSSAHDLAEFLARPGAHCLFIPGDPRRNLETADAAVILPELRMVFQHAFDCALVDDAIDPEVAFILGRDIDALRKQIDTIASTATFDGVNLISAGSTGKIRALANTKATATIDIDHADLSTTGATISPILANLTGGVAGADIDKIDAAIQGVSSALSKLGVGSKSLDRHLDMTSKLQDTFDAGVGNLVDADMAKESARLQALQVKQQLAIMALRIANQGPSLLLSLFRQ